MAALLVAMGVMAIMMTVAMPAWKQQAQREKEAELAFRGEQYVRAIALYGRKHGPGTLPPTIDALMDEHFLRKKYKDPITDDDFLVLTQGSPVGTATPGRGAQGTASPGATSPGTTFGGTSFGFTTQNQPGRGGQPGAPAVGGRGGIIGVQSKSKDKSIRLYKGATHYIEWPFIYQPTTQAPGAGTPGTTTPGRGAPGSTTPGGIGGVGGTGRRGAPPGRGNPQGPGRGTFTPGQPVTLPPPGRGRG